MEKFNASSASFNSRVNLVDQVLANMTVQQSGNSNTSILMAGDPGVGKTSFARFFSKIMGMTLITIEAPHITEEHVINIPFIVFNQVHNVNKSGNQQVEYKGADMHNYKLVLADSHLYGEMHRARKISDEELLQFIYGPKSSSDIQKIWEHLGGDEHTMPETIAEVRQRYSVILFLDEFFRQSSPRIRNMLRGILNNKIGSHSMPTFVYPLYASNLATSAGATGIEGVPLNTDFSQIEFEAPEKDDWFAWLVNKFEKDEKVKLNMDIIEKFHKILDQEDLNHLDVDKEIRVSPRRWEQILLYVNASIPVKDQKEAKSLLTNIKASFKNYETGEHTGDTGTDDKPGLMQKVLDAVTELINETSDVNVNANSTHSDDEWRTTLQHQIEVKMKLGEHRSYVPIISGAPGIGKTTEMMKIAKDEDLRYIYVECSNLDPEDTTGIPMSKAKEDDPDGIELHFSFPKLYRQIMEDIEKQDRQYKQKLRAAGKTKEADDYDSRDWKYLIFFDEMNRTSTKVFNALRRVILEKDFGDDHKLPKEAVIVAAINPTDIGTSSLTGHMRDVVDVIGSAPSWKSTVKYMDDKLAFKQHIAPEMAGKIISVVKQFAEKFADTNPNRPADQKQFHLDIGADNLYLSPREYVTMVSNSAELVNIKLKRLLPKFYNAKDEDERKAVTEQIDHDVKDAVYQKMSGVIKNVMTKHNSSSPEFLHTFKQWIFSLEDLDILTKTVETLTFDEIMDHYYGKDEADLSDEVEFNNYIKAVDANQFSGDLRNFLLKHVMGEDEILRHILDAGYPKKTLQDMVVKYEEEQVSKVEHFIREIVHAIKIHNMSNEFLAAIKTGVLAFLKHMQTNHADIMRKHVKGMMNFNQAVQKFVRDISNVK